MKINKALIFTTLIAPVIVGVLVDIFTSVEVWQFIKDSAAALWNVLSIASAWIYQNIVWFEIPLWALVIVVLFVKLVMKYKNNFSTEVEEEAKHSLIQIHSGFDEHTRELFKFFIIQMNRGTRTSSYELNRYGKENNLSKLELEDLVNDMIRNNLLEGHPNYMEETHFTLSGYGKKIAVALIKQSKVGSKDGNRVGNQTEVGK